MEKQSLFKAGQSSFNYYRTMNAALKKLNGGYRMLHYPFYKSEEDDFIKGQENLVDYCVEKLPELKGKKLLDVGCGNGIQSIYIHQKYAPGYILGIDLNHENISIGLNQKKKLKLSDIDFITDDAHKLEKIRDNSFDYLINIESAFHYPDKDKYIRQIERVLKPGGIFIIADILKNTPQSYATKSWKGKMNFHHWSLEEYKNAFKETALVIDDIEDITPQIIKGFNNIDNFKAGDEYNMTKRVLLNLFFRINVRLNTHLLRKKRLYMIFNGSKNLN